jgi:hypothetical protein
MLPRRHTAKIPNVVATAAIQCRVWSDTRSPNTGKKTKANKERAAAVNNQSGHSLAADKILVACDATDVVTGSMPALYIQMRRAARRDLAMRIRFRTRCRAGISRGARAVIWAGGRDSSVPAGGDNS